ncbi:phosphate regulon sensor histidine kinase PhoR [Pontibacter sp. JAM-7]|uniref:phosphate regulon sensor histidine kinase PhoR n=1 Tax=Pontibacter sp. JAM-7 TaxID=3366581 RepID=UPI003AF8BB79
MGSANHNLFFRLGLISVIALAVGFLLDAPGWTLAIALLVWSILELRRFRQLSNWVHNNDDQAELPESKGRWGELFDGLSRLQRRQNSRETLLRGVIDRFQQSSSALPDAIIIIDRNNNMEWWNETASRLLGLRPLTDRGRPVMNLLRDPRFIRYYNRGQYTDPITLPSPVKSEFSIQYQITRFGDGDRLLVARDVSRLIRLEQTRQDFVANASHELRTPLTVIRGYLETFLDNEMPQHMQRGLKAMQQQARRMENLVSDLLLLSRLEASQAVSSEQPIQIHSILRHILDAAKELGRDKQQNFKLEMDQKFDLCGQEVELHSAFSNLVFNAVRYTQTGGDISIRWWVDAKGGHFAVTDNGPGIESIHLPRLTERFYRVDESRSSASGGTGLGLAIVKHVLVRHGGELTINSKLNQGSTFCCHFPTEMLSHQDDNDLVKIS